MVKVLIATLLCAVSISSSAAFPYLSASNCDAVISMFFSMPPHATRYVDFQLNGHDLGVQSIITDEGMYMTNDNVKAAITEGLIYPNKENTFDFYECKNANCATKTLASQTVYDILFQQKAGSSIYTAIPTDYIKIIIL